MLGHLCLCLSFGIDLVCLIVFQKMMVHILSVLSEPMNWSVTTSQVVYERKLFTVISDSAIVHLKMVNVLCS